MNNTQLGRTGLKISRLCLGTMTFGGTADENTSFQIMDKAYDAGINFFDTADIYSRWIDGNIGGESERVIGKWLKTRNRREIVIATKVRAQMWDGANGEGLSRHHIIQAVEDSLMRLQTDYIDLYQAHWYDEQTPIDETLHAFDHLIQSGKVRYIGCSNYPAWRLMKALWTSDTANLASFATVQPHYSLFNRKEFEAELMDACLSEGIGVIPYSPLAAGFATGKYTRDNTTPESTRSDGSLIKRLINNPDAYAVMDIVYAIAHRHDVPPAQIALAWLLAKPVITAPIIGARKPEQLDDVIGATDVQLSTEDVMKLDEASAMF